MNTPTEASEVGLTRAAYDKITTLSYEIRQAALKIAVEQAYESGKRLIESHDMHAAFIQAAYEVLEEPFELVDLAALEEWSEE